MIDFPTITIIIIIGKAEIEEEQEAINKYTKSLAATRKQFFKSE